MFRGLRHSLTFFYAHRARLATPPTSVQEPRERASDKPGCEAPLEEIISELNVRSSQQINTLGLVFTKAPCIDDESPAVPSMDRNDLRLSPLALSQGPSENKLVAGYEEWLISAKCLVSNQTTARGPTSAIVASLEVEYRKLQIQKASEWRRQQAVARCKESVGALRIATLKPDHAAVVDTGESVYFTRPLSLSHAVSSTVSLSLFSFYGPRYHRVLLPRGNSPPAVRAVC